jgi:GNAT superfamily N-acetyltransferase
MNVIVTAEPFDSRDAQRLIAALDAGLAELYPPEQRFGPNFKPEQIEGGRGTFLVAWDGDRAVGCGAIRVLDPTTAEVKRMYVEPNHRGMGVGWAVLAAPASPQIDCWGEYASAPTSICFEKNLPAR